MGKNNGYMGLYAIYEWFMFLVVLSSFLTSCLLLSFVGICLNPVLCRSQRHSFGRQGIHFGSRLLFAGMRAFGLAKMDFRDLDKLRDERGIIISPNHPCLMDALFVTSRLPNVVCVMKGSIINNPLFFGFASLGGFIRSDAPARFIQKCNESLGDGAQLLIFPEGTRTLSDSVNPFKGGLALVAQKTGASIQSVFIDANTNFLGKHWPIWKKPSFPLIYRITLGERFNVGKEQDHRVFTKKLEDYFKKSRDVIT